MKLIVAFLALLFLGTVVLGQTDTIIQDMTFMGIPIKGSINEFSAKLEEKGFTKKSQKDVGAMFSGLFIGKDCKITVLNTLLTKTTWSVKVFFPEQESWYSLKSEYKNMCENLKIKYGQPSSTYDFFSKPYFEGDGYELQALSKSKCTYASFWNLKNGTISCNIASMSAVSITYQPATGVLIKKQEEAQKAQEEL